MGTKFATVIFNAREEAVSSDENRVGSLASKALQDELLAESIDSTGTPINSFTRTPTLAGVAATMTAALGIGEAVVFDGTITDPDSSQMQVLQWPAQSLVFANPDPTNPRIDLVVATPAMVAGDNSVRNVLQNPTSRAFAPATVPKTQRPIATLAVVAGTPAATPVPPATPAGATVLFEVAVPAAAADATAFLFYQRLFRRTAYPLTGGLNPSNTLVPVEAPACGVLRGCTLVYTGTFEAISQGSSGQAENQVAIDGEVISFATATSSGPGSADSLNNPFASAAPGTNDVPFFLYVVGGRNAPQGYPNAYPVALVASLTAPNTKTGRPSSPIMSPRGVATQSATYVGIGFVRKGTTSHQKCFAAGGLVNFNSATASDVAFEEQVGLAVADNAVTLASAPSVSDEVMISIGFNSGGPGSVGLRLPGMDSSNTLSTISIAAAGSYNTGAQRLPIALGSGPHFQAKVAGAGTTINVGVVAYRTNVRRLG